MRLAAALACMGSACAVDRAPAPISQVPVGGSSPLVALLTQVAGEEGVAADELAAASWVRERFWLDDDAVLAADVAAVRDGSIADAIDAALARGIDGRDKDGGRIVVAARRASGGLGEIAQGLDFTGATWAPASTSNYQTASRGIADIDHIVIHDTEGAFAGTVSWFQDPAAQVSAHYVVRSSDGHIDQMVAEKNIAWHDKCFNTNTVGIEHEGFEAHPELWYTEAMYEASAKLTSYLADKYNIAKQHGPILGHGEAPDCSDHTDPGPGWNWDHYIELVQAGGAGEYLAGDITVDAPATLESGAVATVTVTIANHGTSAWDLDATRVGTAEPQDRASDLFVAGNWIAPNRAAAVEAQTPAGGVGTFTFQIVGPPVTEPIVDDEAFQLVEEGSAWFGPEFHITVQILPVAATIDGTPGNAGCNAGGGAGCLVALALLGLRRRKR